MKHILITGSTDGIGKLAAIKLAKDGHSIYLHGRNKEKMDAVVSEIYQTVPNAAIKGFIADFANLAEVVEMGEKVTSELTQLDVLINNAGVYKTSEPMNAAGLDMRLTVNFLAPVALTKKLLPLLRQSADGRVINLSSAAQAAVSLEVVSGKKQASEQDSYAQSKLALTMWSMHLANKEKNLTVIPVNPGSLLNTRMVREAFGNHWSPADKGGSIIYDLALGNQYKGQSGNYFDNDKGDPRGEFSKAHADAYNQDKIKALVDVVETIIH